MQYRAFGQLDWKPSALGFGAMRLPVIDNDPGQIDEPEATRMLRAAIDGGINYVDTAYPYHGGTSESFVGRALQDGYRERIRLATKLPSWLVKEPADFDRYLNEQLERLQTKTIDFYLLHALNEKFWPNLCNLKVFDWAERAMADGRIGHLGFSFHDTYDIFQEIVDAYDWTFCQIQYNYMDKEHQAGTRGLQYAAGKGLAVVIMEPIRGGLLARRPPRPVVELWESAPRQRTPTEWALQWVWNHPEVSLLLSGMSTLEQVKQNIASAARSGSGALTAEEVALVSRVRDKYRELAPIPCTNCKYCLPCPSGVNIPRILEIYNEAVMYGDLKTARMFYSWLQDEEKADVCVQCGNCEELCPQTIKIINWLATAHHRLLGTGT